MEGLNSGGFIWSGVSNFVVLLLIAVIIAMAICGAAKLVKHAWNSSTIATKQTPLDSAKERYARGEINKEQLEQIKKDLT